MNGRKHKTNRIDNHYNLCALYRTECEWFRGSTTATVQKHIKHFREHWQSLEFYNIEFNSLIAGNATTHNTHKSSTNAFKTWNIVRKSWQIGVRERGKALTEITHNHFWQLLLNTGPLESYLFKPSEDALIWKVALQFICKLTMTRSPHSHRTTTFPYPQRISFSAYASHALPLPWYSVFFSSPITHGIHIWR